MKRGEIYFANLDPTVGSEVSKQRPVLIVSNDANNRASPTITVVPITSDVSRIFPFEVAVAPDASGLPKPSKIKLSKFGQFQSRVLWALVAEHSAQICCVKLMRRSNCI